MTSRLAIMMGGRIAEDMIFGQDKVTSGAQSDIEQATRLAKMMVTRWGFSPPELAPSRTATTTTRVFLGMSMGRQQSVSESTAQKIDAEVRRLVETGLEEARRILAEHKDDLEALAQGLLEYETLSGERSATCSRASPRSATAATCRRPRPGLLGPLGGPRPAEGERRRPEPQAAAAGLRHGQQHDHRKGRPAAPFFRAAPDATRARTASAAACDNPDGSFMTRPRQHGRSFGAAHPGVGPDGQTLTPVAENASMPVSTYLVVALGAGVAGFVQGLSASPSASWPCRSGPG